MGSAEGPLDHEAAPDRPAGGGVDPRHLQRLVGFERGQNRREAPGQQRLPGARTADHQQMVPTGGRHLERSAGADQAPDDGEVGPGVVVARPVAVVALDRSGRRRPVTLAL